MLKPELDATLLAARMGFHLTPMQKGIKMLILNVRIFAIRKGYRNTGNS